ncbi:Cytoplasmic polyadenylation element-binding protein 1 [Branchiostoma belcheri]|nr:Cytoplasmic polyadenylation element-binding protein 1 [Branchiostoma belcheri]
MSCCYISTEERWEVRGIRNQLPCPVHINCCPVRSESVEVAETSKIEECEESDLRRSTPLNPDHQGDSEDALSMLSRRKGGDNSDFLQRINTILDNTLDLHGTSAGPGKLVTSSAPDMPVSTAGNPVLTDAMAGLSLSDVSCNLEFQPFGGMAVALPPTQDALQVLSCVMTPMSIIDRLVESMPCNPTIGGEGFSHLYDRRIERDARMYRNAAAMCEPTCTWSGQLPMRQHKCPIYSPKVFLGGVPWDITEVGLQAAFKPFGPINVEWPGKDNKHPRYPPKGYVYVLFESDKAVKSLLQACTHEFSHGGEFFYKISSRRLRCKKVEIIPWVTSDSNYVRCPSQRLDPGKTVFVGALHGRLNAERLANIMNDLFGGVVYAGIDTDKHKYPIGSGRVTFGNHKSYMKAVQAAFIEIKTPKFTKKVQVDPYLEDSLCNTCNSQPGPFFCREMSCFRYYCPSCWQWHHSLDTLRHHQPLLRNKKSCSRDTDTDTDY